jgi:VIT1/CCC1 family predicted Fe2+/Mn2+ transporter
MQTRNFSSGATAAIVTSIGLIIGFDAATAINFAARLGLSLSFVFLMMILPLRIAVAVSILWGSLLLTGLSYVLARSRKLPVRREITKHVAVAIVVMSCSKMIGHMIQA